MSASSYFSSKFPAMRVVLVESAPICIVFTGTWSGSDGWTLGAFAGASWVARWMDPPRNVQPLPPEHAVSQLQRRQRCGRPTR